jgi:predicted Fe-Mo cluster-binding NifX family protein
MTMKLCIPVSDTNGLDSAVCGYFGSAPAFIIVDTDTLSVETISNNNAHHAHGQCQPLAAISGRQIDAIAVSGIGAGAIGKLHAAGIKVYKVQHPTVRETADAMKKGLLSQMDAKGACGGHAHVYSCGGHGT